MSDFARRLREIREAKGMSLYRLAQLVDLSKQGVYNLEADGSDPKLSTLAKLAKALDVMPWQLLPGWSESTTVDRNDGTAHESTVVDHATQSTVVDQKEESITVDQCAAFTAPHLAQPGEEFTILKLKRLYDEHVARVLSDYLDEIEPPEVPKGKRRPMDRYRVVGPLPSRAAYDALKVEYFTSTAGKLADEAYDALEEIASELENWADNLPENLQYGNKADQIREVVSAIERLDRPDVPAGLAGLPVTYVWGNSGSRPGRRNDATGQLRAVIDVLRAGGTTAGAELAGHLEGNADDADAIEFPGMFD